jgi:hypothetical protein
MKDKKLGFGFRLSLLAVSLMISGTPAQQGSTTIPGGPFSL